MGCGSSVDESKEKAVELAPTAPQAPAPSPQPATLKSPPGVPLDVAERLKSASLPTDEAAQVEAVLEKRFSRRQQTLAHTPSLDHYRKITFDVADDDDYYQGTSIDVISENDGTAVRGVLRLRSGEGSLNGPDMTALLDEGSVASSPSGQGSGGSGGTGSGVLSPLMSPKRSKVSFNRERAADAPPSPKPR